MAAAAFTAACAFLALLAGYLVGVRHAKRERDEAWLRWARHWDPNVVPPPKEDS